MSDKSKIYDYIKRTINPYGKPFKGTVYEFGIKIMDYIKNMDDNNGLIPVSERLPESTLPVLCRVKSTTISCTESYIIGSYCNGCWFFQNDTVGTHSFPLSEYKVLAWMPLPEPYEED